MKRQNKTAPPPKAKLQIKLTNRWAIFIDCPPEVQTELKKLFRFRRPGFEFAPSYRDGSWDGWINLFSRSRVAAGLFLERREEVEEKFALNIVDERAAPQFREAATGDLRPYQLRAVEAMVAASNTGGILLSATGSGKSKTAGEYCRRLIGTAVFVVDELALLEQARRELGKAMNEEVGIVGRSEFKPRRVTVATIQTLHKHRESGTFIKWFKSLDVLIIDEIHIALNRRNADVVTQIWPKAVFGLTATLEMQKPHVHLPVVAMAGPVIFEYPITEGVEEGYLSTGKVVRILFHDPLRGQAPGYWSLDGGLRVYVGAASTGAKYRYHIVLNQKRNDCVEQVVRAGIRAGHRVIVLVERRIHLRMLSKRLADIPHKSLSGEQDAELRLDAMTRMDAGTLPLILASRVFSKGVDVRSVSMIVDVTALPGRNSAMQRYGRGARKVEGKAGLWYVDISDTTGPYAGAAASRAIALHETGAKAIALEWGPDCAEKLEKLLRKSTPASSVSPSLDKPRSQRQAAFRPC